MPIQKKMGSHFEEWVCNRLGWKQRDKGPQSRVADVVGVDDKFCGECKTTDKASRTLSLSEIQKIETEAIKFGNYNWVFFTELTDPKTKEKRQFATVDFGLFQEMIDKS